MSATTVSSTHRHPQEQINRAYSVIGKTWATMGRTPVAGFEPIIDDLLDSAKGIYSNPFFDQHASLALQTNLDLIHRRAKSPDIDLWKGSPSFEPHFFVELDRCPGLKENYIALLLATILAKNIEAPSFAFFTNDFNFPDELQKAIEEFEKERTISWLQAAWQCRFKDVGPETNTHLKWEETAKAIQDSVKEVIGDKKLAEITDTDLYWLRINIHEKMRERNLWFNEKTRVKEHDVDFGFVGCEGTYNKPEESYTSSMEDNYMIMALVGLIPKSEYKVMTIGEEIGSG